MKPTMPEGMAGVARAAHVVVVMDVVVLPWLASVATEKVVVMAVLSVATAEARL
jgi:hypothetical protein